MENWIIRKIEKRDNAAVAQLIRAVFDELNIQSGYCMQILIWT
jgi:putative acetyltransferase